jgi:hypothetical protein
MIANAFAMPRWGAIANAYAMPAWGGTVSLVGSHAPPSHFGALPPLVQASFGRRISEADAAEYEALRQVPESKLTDKQKLRVNDITGKGLFKIRGYATNPSALCPTFPTIYVPKEAINIVDLLGKADGPVRAYERWALANPCSGALQRSAAKTYFNKQFRRYGGSAAQSAFDAFTGQSTAVDPLTGATITDAGGTSVDAALQSLLSPQPPSGLPGMTADAAGTMGASGEMPWGWILGGVAVLGAVAYATQRGGKKKGKKGKG